MKRNDIERLINSNVPAQRRVEKSNEEWKLLLTPEQYRITRMHGTEAPYSGQYCESYGRGQYHCVCCQAILFNSTQKFSAGTGWPSFNGPITTDAIRYNQEVSYDVNGVEVLCNVCEAHLGHVFLDGSQPTGLRFCINSLSIEKIEPERLQIEALPMEIATLGAGCFWCTEAIFEELEGVLKVVTGYAGGVGDVAMHEQAFSGHIGHAEVIQIYFNPQKISYAELLRTFFATHDPTILVDEKLGMTLKYRSIVLCHDAVQKRIANDIRVEMQQYFPKPIMTEVSMLSRFFEAEQGDQNYYRNNPDNVYCQVVINPKLQKFRSDFSKTLKETPRNQSSKK